MTFKVGAQILTYGSTWDEALDTVRSLDELGYHYIWGHDHLYSTGGNPQQQFFEGWLTIAAWAQATERVRIGLTVGNNTFGGRALFASTVLVDAGADADTTDLVTGNGNFFAKPPVIKNSETAS